MTDANSLVALGYRMNLEEAEATEMHLGMRCLLGINNLEKKGWKQGWEEGQACLGEGVQMTALRGHHPPLSVCFHPLRSFGLRHRVLCRVLHARIPLWPTYLLVSWRNSAISGAQQWPVQLVGWFPEGAVARSTW